jgi:ATP-binding cassette subfamily C protein CydD
VGPAGAPRRALPRRRAGLPTLALFRRSAAVADQVRRVTGEHRDATLRTLRVAFLSAFVLELLATLAVALVAVQVGLRLLYGQLDLATALLVLVLAPEAYLPLREVGRPVPRQHRGRGRGRAGVRGARPPLPRTGGTVPAAPRRIRVDDVTLTWPGRTEPAFAHLSLDLAAGRTTLLTGPSGAGKSSLLALLLRFADPTSGRIEVDGTDGRSADLADLDAAAWRRLVAWVPQHPHLLDTCVADNIRLGDPNADDAAVERAARAAGVHDVVARLPQGYATRLGERGLRLSSGERQRLALARAFLRRAAGAPVVLLDEPTAHLDAATADGVRAAAGRLLDGALGVVVAHDAGWEALADDVVHLAELVPA